jgi:long-chain fatty acid transport protein
LAVLVALLFTAASAMAAGFRLPEAGAKAMGMGFAFTAQADDPSAIYFNPAGLTQLEGTNVMIGGTYVRGNGGEFTGITPLTGGVTRTETQKDLNFFIPNAYVTRKASPNFSYGVGIFAPFGLGQEYDNPAASIFRNQVTRIDLQTVVVNPTVAWKINEMLSVGAGIDFMWGNAELEKFAISGAGANLFKFNLEGDGTAWGYNFGILVKPVKDLNIGINFRSPFHLKIKDGDVTLTDNNLALGGPFPATSQAKTTIKMPATAALGVAYRFLDKLTIEGDVDWTFWSSFDELNIQNESSPALTSTPTGRQRNWKDVAAFRIGGEYRVTAPLAIRLGFAYDKTPVPASTMGAELPDADRLNYMAGVGYKFANWTIDGSYFYVRKKDRTVSNIRLEENGNPIGFNGTWKGDSHLVALDVGYRF